MMLSKKKFWMLSILMILTAVMTFNGAYNLSNKFFDSLGLRLVFNLIFILPFYFLVFLGYYETMNLENTIIDHIEREYTIKQSLERWRMNEITTKDALQEIDAIYDHYYTKHIVIKDGDK